MTATPSTDSRIANSSRSWQGACDVDITDWDKANEFILSTWMTSDIGHGNETKNWKLQWKRTGGSFVDVGADTEIAIGTGTVLVNDTDLNSGNSAGCQTPFGTGEESEGDNAQALKINAGDEGEIQWALDFGSGAIDSQEYEFQIVNTDDTTDAICSVSITTLTPTTYKVEGITKNNAGDVLGSCLCFLLKDNLDDTYDFIAYQLSNSGTGVYSFTGLTDNDANYQVIAWKDDGTHVFDVTDHVLVPVVE